MTQEEGAARDQGTVSWTVRLQNDDWCYPDLLKPNQFGKYGVSMSYHALTARLGVYDLVEGVRTQSVKTVEGKPHLAGEYVRCGSGHAPQLIIQPDDPVEIIRLEDAWLREHSLAASLNRPVRLGAISQVVVRIDLAYYRERFNYSGKATHALGLQKVLIHEVGRS